MTTITPWLARRRQGLTSTDVAKILGMDGAFGDALTVWADKTGQIPPADLSAVPHVRWGNYHEPAILAEYQQQTGRAAVPPEQWGDHLPGATIEVLEHHGKQKVMLASRAHPLLLATPDLVVASWTPLPWLDTQDQRDGPGIGEAKSTHQFHAADWIDGATPAYRAQLQHLLLVSGLSWGSVPVLIGSCDFRVFDVGAFPRWQEWALEQLERFWRDCVVGGRAPDAGPSEVTTRLLAELHPADNGEAVPLEPEFAALDARREELKAAEKAIDVELRGIDNRIKAAIGSNTYGRIEGSPVQYTWGARTRKAYWVEETTYRSLTRKVERLPSWT